MQDGSRKLAVVIPTYNEASTIVQLIQQILAVAPSEWDLVILVVDDGSPDGTAGKVRQMMDRHSEVRLLERSGKLGLGSAYLDGFRHLRNTVNPEVYVQMDADFSHPPEYLGRLVSSVSATKCIILASRYVIGGGTSGWSLTRRVVSSVANLLGRLFIGLSVHDMTTGYRALP